MINHDHVSCIGSRIGAHYENALAALDIPGSEFYVPYPTDAMSCDSIEANIQLLNTFIGIWNQRLRDAEHEFIRSKETIDNCQTIIKNLSTKLGGYMVRRDVCNAPVVITPPVDNTGEDTGDQTGGDTSGGGSSNNTLLWLAVVGVAGYAIYRTRQRGQTRAKKTRRF